MLKRGNRIALVGVAAIVLAVAAGIELLPRSASQAPARPGASGAAPPDSAGSEASARTWQLGGVRLHACDLDQSDSGASVAAWCAKMTVPENRAASGGRAIDLNLAVVRSDAADPRDDMVALLAGGPGQAATRIYRIEAAALDPLRRHRHILLLDQRGTGGSNALTCDRGGAAGEKPAATAPTTIEKQTKNCLDHNEQHADPRYYTTTDAVADLEAVREELGAPKLDLIGISYGTRLAQQYAARYPDSVRSLVLDGVVPNTQRLGNAMAINLQRVVDRVLDGCSETPACRRRFGDPSRTLDGLSAHLMNQPRRVRYRDPKSFETRTRTLDADTLASVLRLFAYSSETAALMPLAIDKAANGDAAPLMAQAQLINSQVNTSLTGGMAMSVLCSEDAPGLRTRPVNRDTLLGNRLIKAIQAQCRVWPKGRMPADFHRPLKSDIPALLVSGARDPVTPPRFASAVAAHLTRARSVTLNGQGHNNIMRGCMPDLIERFIEDLRPATLDAGCLDRLRPTPAFLSFNGAGS